MYACIAFTILKDFYVKSRKGDSNFITLSFFTAKFKRFRKTKHMQRHRNLRKIFFKVVMT